MDPFQTIFHEIEYRKKTYLRAVCFDKMCRTVQAKNILGQTFKTIPGTIAFVGRLGKLITWCFRQWDLDFSQGSVHEKVISESLGRPYIDPSTSTFRCMNGQTSDAEHDISEPFTFLFAPGAQQDHESTQISSQHHQHTCKTNIRLQNMTHL